LNQANLLLAKCQNLETALKEIIKQKPFFANFNRYLFEDSFGTLDQVFKRILSIVLILLRLERKSMKPMLLNVYHFQLSEELLLTGNSIVSLHFLILISILIMGHSEGKSNDENENQKKFDTSRNTMIFCQPNAGYYEAMLQDVNLKFSLILSLLKSEWIDFYLDNGLNVFLWNYRGFAKSTGTPNPDVISNIKFSKFLNLSLVDSKRW